MRQVVWLLYELSIFKTNCSGFGLTVLLAKLVTELRAVCDPTQGTAKDMLCVEASFKNFMQKKIVSTICDFNYARNLTIYDIECEVLV